MPIPTYSIGSIVYLRVNQEKRGMVTGYTVRAGNILLYLVTWGDPVEETEHWIYELSDEPTFEVGGGE